MTKAEARLRSKRQLLRDKHVELAAVQVEFYTAKTLRDSIAAFHKAWSLIDQIKAIRCTPSSLFREDKMQLSRYALRRHYRGSTTVHINARG